MSDQGPTVFKKRYELHRKLARGGMSDVYLARDQVLDRPVAVKVLFPEFAKDATFVERFRREAQAAARLNHPNVVSVYDWGEEQGTYFIAMEYVEGRSLSEIIRAEGPLHPRRVAEITGDVASALGFAHRNGVVHRDIKPGNVMIETRGQVKVADFGIAQALSGPEQTQLTRVGSVMGTATYFSPEQAQGKPVDARTDLYSLGCVMFEMLTTRPPFSGESPVAIAYKHVQEPAPTPSSIGVAVPTGLEAIVMQLLSKDPDQRYDSAEDLRGDLRRFLAGQPVLAAAAVGAGLGFGATAGMATVDPTAAMGATTALPPATGGYPPVPEDDPSRPRGSGLFIGALMLLLLALGVGLFYIGSNMSKSSNRPQVAVPGVVGRSVDEATTMLTSKGFEVKRVDSVNDKQDEGIVFLQDPKAETQIDTGSVVTITVSTGSETEVPDVTGLDESAATSSLKNADLQVNSVPQPSPTVPNGQVISQTPVAHTKKQKNSVVTIIVSSGKEPVPIPDLTSNSATSAANQLGQLGFHVEQKEEASDDIAKGKVIRTDPPAGQKADPDSTPVTLFVSSGPQATTTTSTSTTTTTKPTTTTTTETPTTKPGTTKPLPP
jgi:beta-lactam-binding protein with PASTA domain/predicted Ser/Thr protein kinase